MNDIHSTQIWNKCIQPVLSMQARVGITISPPANSTAYALTNISEITSATLNFMGVRSYFVLEQDSNHRWHWHGLLGMSNERANQKKQICEFLRQKLDGFTYCDFIYKFKSLTSWISYTLKDQKFIDGQKEHANIAKYPRIPHISTIVCNEQLTAEQKPDFLDNKGDLLCCTAARIGKGDVPSGTEQPREDGESHLMGDHDGGK